MLPYNDAGVLCLITKYFECAFPEGSVKISQMCRLVWTFTWCPRAIKQSKFRIYIECFQHRLKPACASIQPHKSLRYSRKTSSLYMRWIIIYMWMRCKYFVCANREGSVQTSQMCRLVLTSPWCPRAIKQSKFRTYLECFQRRLRPACASIHFYKSIRYSCETSSLYMWAMTWDF